MGSSLKIHSKYTHYLIGYWSFSTHLSPCNSYLEKSVKFKLRCSNGSLCLLVWLVSLYTTWPLPCSSIRFRPFSPISPWSADNIMGFFLSRASLLALPYAWCCLRLHAGFLLSFVTLLRCHHSERSFPATSPEVVSLFLFKLVYSLASFAHQYFYHYSDIYLIVLKCVCCQWNVTPWGQRLCVLFRATIPEPTTRSLVKTWNEWVRIGNKNNNK